MRKLSSEERFERLLTLVPQVIKAGGTASLSELSERFEYPLARLKADLKGILRYVAPWPRTYEWLLQVNILGDTVSIENAEFFERPPQFSWEEALGLYTSASAVLGAKMSANQNLLSAARKLKSALEARAQLSDFERVLQVDVAEEIAPQIWSDILEALRARRRLRIKYYSFGRGQTSRREVDVHAVFVRGSSWHMGCWCHQAQAVRIFKCDQIEQAELTGETFEPRPELDFSPGQIYQAEPGDARVVLRLLPDAFWVIQAYDTEDSRLLDDGSLEVTLAVGNERFMKYLLLLVGSSAELLAGTSGGADVSDGANAVPSDLAVATVDEILGRYQNS